MASPDATAPLTFQQPFPLLHPSLLMRTSGINQSTPAGSQDPKHGTHHVAKRQRLPSPSSCSGAASTPLPCQPSFGMRPEQLRARTPLHSAPRAQTLPVSTAAITAGEDPNLSQLEGGRVTADGRGLFILLWEERHLFGSCKCKTGEGL